MIPYGYHLLCQQDIEEVLAVLKSGQLTQGPVVPAFESDIANYCQADYAIAVNSATSALHLACAALELGPQDEVWTSALTFVASANCALHCGATIDFVDIDPRTFNISVSALHDKLQQRVREGRRLPSVVIPVHMCGQPCDMKGIGALAAQYGFKVIEDASHALGSRSERSTTGACQYSDISVFSFHPVKIITSAEGGMATTNSAALARRMQVLRYHGITRETAEMSADSATAQDYQQIMLGFNFRLSDLQAALGRSQFRKLDSFVQKRHELAARYDLLLRELPVAVPYRRAEAYSSFHLYVVLLPSADLQSSALGALRASNIGATLHYPPVHLQPFYRARGFGPGDFPLAEDYASKAITLPLYPGMTHSQQDEVVQVLAGCLQ